MFTCVFITRKGSSSCSAPLPGHANSPGFHVSGCWAWQCSRLSLGAHPSSDRKVAGTPGPPFPAATGRVCAPRLAGSSSPQAAAVSRAAAAAELCAGLSSPSGGTSGGCRHREFTKTTLTQPWAPGTFMGNLQVPVTISCYCKCKFRR